MRSEGNAFISESLSHISTAGIFLMAAIWALGLGVHEFRLWEPSPDGIFGKPYIVLQHMTSPFPSSVPIIGRRPYKIKSDLSLGGLELDMKEAEIQNARGHENTRKTEDTTTKLTYDNLNVSIWDQRLKYLGSEDSSASTKRGIHPGSAVTDMLKSYDGNDYAKFEDVDDTDAVLYEFSFLSVDQNKGVLRFVTSKSTGTVKRIAVYYRQKIHFKNPEVDKGRLALEGYYDDVKGQFYDIAARYELTNGFAERMYKSRGFDRYSKFRSAELTNIQCAYYSANNGEMIMHFHLAAHVQSKDGEKVKHFNGRAQIVAEGGRWSINDIYEAEQK